MKRTNKIISLILSLMLFASPVFAMPASARATVGKWVATWGTSIVNGNIHVAGTNFQDYFPSDSTVRIELQVSTGGEQLKFKFSNQYGSEPLIISQAAAAKTEGRGNAEIQPSTSVPLTFHGSSSISIPAGRTMWSDPVAISTSPLDRITVSLYFRERTEITSTGLANARTFLSMSSVFGSGKSQVSNAKIGRPSEVNISSGTITYHTTPFLCEVDTLKRNKNACTAVFIGDSTLVNNTYLYYAQKLINAGARDIGVINQAVVGNKLMSDGSGIIGNLYGTALKDRYERDALSIPGVKYIFIKIGLNDVAHQFSKSLGKDTPKLSAAQIIEGYKDLAARADARGIRVYFFTKSPWKGYERSFLGQKGDLQWDKNMQSMCDELDNWVKTNKIADGYIDCSPLANPADPYAMCPSFTPDGAHLTNIASIALADLIPLSFAGVNAPDARTAAAINGVNPYEEKNKIIYDMQHPTTRPPEPVTQPHTEEPTQPVPERPTVPEATTAPSADIPTAPAVPQVTVPPVTTPSYAPPVDVPVINGNINPGTPFDPQPIPQGDFVDPNYQVVDKEPEKIGSGVNIGFVLFLFAVVIAAGVVLILTLGKKRDEEM